MNAPSIERARVIVRGAVQGVGFRPFVYRHATELRLLGWVLNSAQGVFIDIEGAGDSVREFVSRLETEKPPRAVIRSVECSYLDPTGYDRFEIRESDDAGGKSVLILPDLATCADCTREIFDPSYRRHRYPFTNCTNCGPRFSIIESLPYDRANTSMKKFAMCADCAREYHDPLDRRFHAQPNACPRCGPQLELWDSVGAVLVRRNEALLEAAQIIRDGKILALKGIGGFQLIVDARSDAAVQRLRARKHREEKPFALMYPSLDLARRDCEISKEEERLLLSSESPIVLLRGKGVPAQLSPAVAPGNPYLGVMLPYSPLHHLLMEELGFPVVATSGNLTDEPICIDEHEALARLRNIADFYLVHDRPVVRHMDDSIDRILLGREQLLRRARGYAPFPIHVSAPLPTILALGAHMKTTVALSVGTEIFVSQHIGDLETAAAHAAFRQTAADLPRLYDATPEGVACDLHPDYLSTQFAAHLAAPSCPVQHHFAHVLACMAENELDPPALGVAWDGTGFGMDGTIWGGEFLLARGSGFERVGHLRPFRLPGGDAAARQPRRAALGILFEIFGDALWDRDEWHTAFTQPEARLLRQMLAKHINTPLTSSAGRLFDAVASLAGLRHQCAFEGQAAMELEFAADPDVTEPYPFEIRPGPPHIIDWQPMILALLDDLRRGFGPRAVSARFHNTLAEIIVAIARKAGEQTVVLTGGCFQNRLLTERAVARLRAAGFEPYWHRHIPPNDGGIAPGQIIGAALAMRHQTA
jgi:hydrogenase maturation protein HypF